MTSWASEPAVGLAPKLRDIARFGRDFYAFAGRRGLLAVVLLIITSFTEGVSILLLIPVLHMAGNAAQDYAVAVPFADPTGLLFPDSKLPLASILLAIILLVVGQAVLNRLKSIYMGLLLDEYVATLRVGLFESVGKADWATFSRSRNSTIEHTLTDSIDRVNGATFYFLMLIQSLVMLGVYVGASLLISPVMALLAFMAGGVMLFLLQPMRKHASRFGGRLTDNRKEQFRNIGDLLGGMKVVKSLNVENVYFDRFRETVARSRLDSAAYLRANTKASAAFQIVNGVGLSAFVYFALKIFNLSLAQIVVMLFIFMRIVPRFLELQTYIQQLLLDLPAYESLKETRATFDAAKETQPAVKSTPGPDLKDQIVLDNVSFRFAADALIPTLDGISLTIPARKVTALIGPSGAGKTTIADILLGLLAPSSGVFAVDDLQIDADNRRQWRSQVAYVPQDVFLLHDTIAANLRLAAPSASDEQLAAALATAHAAEFVNRMPAGMDTVVGERGLRLSGGERQRIALARALLRKPCLLILDEATSALDWQSQSLIANSIDALRGSMTILTIAHRPSMIAFADWVISIEAGQIVETGAYGALSKDRRSRLSRMLNAEHAPA